MKRKRQDEEDEFIDLNKPYCEIRRSILCLSMNKLRSPSPVLGQSCRRVEPNLRRSVLICNTVRKIENELKQEGIRIRPTISTIQTAPPCQLLDPPPSTPIRNDIYCTGPWTSLLQMEDDLTLLNLPNITQQQETTTPVAQTNVQISPIIPLIPSSLSTITHTTTISSSSTSCHLALTDLDFATLMLDRDSLSAVLTDSLNALAGTVPTYVSSIGGCNMRQTATEELEHIMEVLVGI